MLFYISSFPPSSVAMHTGSDYLYGFPRTTWDPERAHRDICVPAVTIAWLATHNMAIRKETMLIVLCYRVVHSICQRCSCVGISTVTIAWLATYNMATRKTFFSRSHRPRWECILVLTIAWLAMYNMAIRKLLGRT